MRSATSAAAAKSPRRARASCPPRSMTRGPVFPAHGGVAGAAGAAVWPVRPVVAGAPVPAARGVADAAQACAGRAGSGVRAGRRRAAVPVLVGWRCRTRREPSAAGVPAGGAPAHRGAARAGHRGGARRVPRRRAARYRLRPHQVRRDQGRGPGRAGADPGSPGRPAPGRAGIPGDGGRPHAARALPHRGPVSRVLPAGRIPLPR